VLADAGSRVSSGGAIDFAGGTVVHINAGIAGLMGALLVGKRIGYGKELMPPHSLTMTMIGAALLWVGWFGFNAGSNLGSQWRCSTRDDQLVRRHRGRRRCRGCSPSGWSRASPRSSARCVGLRCGPRRG